MTVICRLSPLSGACLGPILPARPFRCCMTVICRLSPLSGACLGPILPARPFRCCMTVICRLSPLSGACLGPILPARPFRCCMTVIYRLSPLSGVGRRSGPRFTADRGGCRRRSFLRASHYNTPPTLVPGRQAIDRPTRRSALREAADWPPGTADWEGGGHTARGWGGGGDGPGVVDWGKTTCDKRRSAGRVRDPAS